MQLINRQRFRLLLPLAWAALCALGCRDRPGRGAPADPNHPAASTGAAVVTQEVELETDRFTAMGSFGHVRLRCGDETVGREAIADARHVLAEVDRLLSTYRPDSELSHVNQLADRQPVSVSPQTYELLRLALHYSRITDGAFDITVTPLVHLWQQAARENRLPTDAELAQARSRVGYEKLHLGDPNHPTVSFANPGMELNVDAIAQGYGVDLVLDALRRSGITAALVEIGGEIACFGGEPPQRPWRIGVQDPFAADNDNPLAQHARWVLQLTQGGASTSGHYRRHHTIAGRRYSHILDPRTGWPADALPSVTVIAARAADADALATAVSVLGTTEGLALIESLENVQALLVAGPPDRPTLYRSRGLARYETR